MAPRTIALVVSSFVPRVGGVEEHVLHVALELHRRGHRPVVWSVDQGDEGTVAEVGGVPVRYLPCPLPARKAAALASFAYRAPAAAVAWRRAYVGDRPALLHVHCFGPNGVWAGALADMTRTPLVVTSHGETTGDAHGVFDVSGLARAALRRAMTTADAVTGCSQATLDDLEGRFGLATGRGRVVPNGIDLGVAASRPTGWALPDRYLLAVGRAVRTKGFDLLLEAVALARLPEDLHLVIAGDGPDLAPLRAFAEALGISGTVVFPGMLTRGEVAHVMSHAEALVVPSRAEAFGITVLEGWRAAIPVVATTRGGPPEFVTDGVDGLLVDPVDVRALAATLERLAANPAQRAALGAAGHARVPDFSWRRVVDEYVAIYDRTLAGG
ncbi:glycosyltransferase family 4 protein [Cellulomonas sp. P24]|uniref:glycosyltransferase family 4 protein n=1 Tax=Cellulomonas sp. P24 TaxID=2885206 RepID=UPI00216B4408|nr:glycosyltransferase family 4 protein [Cellulomonas sp. P24]MCR6493780.1 glycosyltransferase family 4 protein [Cellulomonas sp. P24]